MTILYYEYSSEVLKHDTLLYRSCWTNHTHKINSYNLVTTTELAYDGGLFTNVSTEAMPLSQSFHRSWKVGMLLQWGNNCQIFYKMEVQYLQSFSIKGTLRGHLNFNYWWIADIEHWYTFKIQSLKNSFQFE